jgi:hypothetical protein
MVKVAKRLPGEVRHEERAVLVHTASVSAQVKDERLGSPLTERAEGTVEHCRELRPLERANPQPRDGGVVEELQGDVATRTVEPRHVPRNHRVYWIDNRATVALKHARDGRGDAASRGVPRGDGVRVPLFDV